MEGFSTDEIMRLALDLIGEPETPRDSGVHVPGTGIKKLLFTMDANVGLLHMAKEMGFDCVLCHHPCGALIEQGEVYARHLDLIEMHGIEKEKALETLGDSLERAVGRIRNKRERMLYRESPNQTVLEVDAARLMGLPFMNMHNAFDEAGRRILQAKIDAAIKDNPDFTLAQVLTLIKELPEAVKAVNDYAITPVIFMGDPETRAARTVFVHGALSAPHPEIIECYWQNGFETVIMLHGEFDQLEKLKKENEGNLILTGHFLGDSIGMTPFIRALRKKGVEVTCTGGIIDIDGL